MHPYATDSAERINVLILLGILSMPLAFGFAAAVKWIGLDVLWWIDLPAVGESTGCF
jgi:hypothetical protein